MFCLFCKNPGTEVIETRLSEDGSVVRRRRQCQKCEKRFTTHERVENLPILVIKSDGRRERFDRDKLRTRLLRAVGKTKVTADQVEIIVNSVEKTLKGKGRVEFSSRVIGEIVAKQLKKFDKIAYIRFASVFRRFVDLEDFEKELKKLL